jgi:hypothetical protein
MTADQGRRWTDAGTAGWSGMSELLSQVLDVSECEARWLYRELARDVAAESFAKMEANR